MLSIRNQLKLLAVATALSLGALASTTRAAEQSVAPTASLGAGPFIASVDESATGSLLPTLSRPVVENRSDAAPAAVEVAPIPSPSATSAGMAMLGLLAAVRLYRKLQRA